MAEMGRERDRNPPNRRGSRNEGRPVAGLWLQRLSARQVLRHRCEQAAIDTGVEVQGMPVARGDPTMAMRPWHLGRFTCSPSGRHSSVRRGGLALGRDPDQQKRHLPVRHPSARAPPNRNLSSVTSSISSVAVKRKSRPSVTHCIGADRDFSRASRSDSTASSAASASSSGGGDGELAWPSQPLRQPRGHGAEPRQAASRSSAMPAAISAGGGNVAGSVAPSSRSQDRFRSSFSRVAISA